MEKQSLEMLCLQIKRLKKLKFLVKLRGRKLHNILKYYKKLVMNLFL